ncbi:zinc-dependent metalloprotease [Mucilaginibacter daejeonensis]|uniref:zinc-dependent metalloprotease n=1 Tax=Mucilaginibacter daejeonensis TaxID=398049 RepID=UPI001D17877D|nr:zinc-dependent metalloprotease [Mucilaginibacter daejeonensis]UEG55185.1 zinc-dependent metalloprotease [Mucilaginibacter daejeonensis]
MNLSKNTTLFFTASGIALTISACSLLQKKKKVVAAPARPISAEQRRADSLKKATALKPYNTIVTTGTKTSHGFFTVHKKDSRWYFEIPNNILYRDILAVSRISKASTDMRHGSSGYAGDQIGESVYDFEKGPDSKLFIRRRSFKEMSKDSTSAMFAGLVKNNLTTIVASFPITSVKPDSSAVVVDVTDFLNADNDVIYFQRKEFKDNAGMGGQQMDKSYVDHINTYPTNVEINAVKTYSAGQNPTNSSYTVELNCSLVLLPSNPMKPRLQDERIGYFTTSFRDFDTKPQGVSNTTYITRWRLEPKPEDVERYKRGELVEPKKPIVYYIDPATPKKWVPYLMQGVNDWQKAFEAAGFKNAIMAKEAPTKQQDSTWSIDDANHAAIIYRPSIVANAMGPSVADPRSGEIIESHIFWYHNVMSILQQWYMVQAGAVDKRARKADFDDELMGTLIRFVSSHEVGHTLGLRHNFGSSSTVPVEKLRDKAWVEANGHTPSIMDYARFNYVAQPEDNIGKYGLFPRIGDYDKWAIKWGYTWRPEYASAQDEHKAMVKVVTDSIRNNHRLWFGGETEYFDPRSQNEDLGDNAMLAGSYGIKNLKRIVPQLHSWLSKPYEGQEELLKGYEGVWGQLSLYVGHVIKNVGGTYHTVRVNFENKPVYTPVPYTRQKQAISFLNKQVFDTPKWLDLPDLQNDFSISFPIELSKLQESTINGVITRMRLSHMYTDEVVNKYKTYTVDQLLSDLNHGILNEVYAGKNVDVYRRNLQKMYLYRLLQQAYLPNEMNTIFAMNTYHFTVSDLNGIMRNNLNHLQALFNKATKNKGLNAVTRTHLQQMNSMITQKVNLERSGLNK